MARTPVVVAEHVQLTFAQSMLDAITTHEHLSGCPFDPGHANARPELRRVAAAGTGAAGYKYLQAPERRCVDRIIDRLLAHSCWAAA